MHFNFHFTTVQVLWTLTFASLLVLLVVLLGRDRMRRFPWFTASIALVALRLLATRLLHNRLPQITMGAVFIVMANISALVGLLVVVEMARRAFGRVTRRDLDSGWLGRAGGGSRRAGSWGPWPAAKSLAFDTLLAKLATLQLLAQKTGLLVDVLTITLGLLIVLFGRRYGAGWRSHVQQIVIGLSTASLAQTAAQAIWQTIVRTAAQPHSEAEYVRVVGLREKLLNANSVVYIAVVIWWIVCLWIDEPGTAAPVAEAVPVGAGLPEGDTPVSLELPEDTQG